MAFKSQMSIFYGLYRLARVVFACFVMQATYLSIDFKYQQCDFSCSANEFF